MSNGLSNLLVFDGSDSYVPHQRAPGEWLLYAPAGSGPLRVSFSLPIIDLNGYWHPDCRQPSTKLEWNISFTSAAHRFWPLLSFFNLEGINRYTCCLSDWIDDCQITARMNQQTASYDCCFTISVPMDEDLNCRLLLETEPVSWTAAVSALIGICHPEAKAAVPAAAWEPVFCTWYAAHADLKQEWVEETARIASELGFGTLILDDGWSYDASQRVNADSGAWYRYAGDWQVSTLKFPDFAGHVRRVQNMGLKYMLWVTPFLLGDDSRFRREQGDCCLQGEGTAGYHLLNLDCQTACERMTEDIVQLLIHYGLDGLKLDFIDKPDPSVECPIGRNIASYVSDLVGRIRQVNQEAMIEFRETYAQRSLWQFATQFRAGDVPLDWMDNFRRLAKIHMELGDGVPAHADPAYWHPEELPVNISRHLMASLMGVPMLSMPLLSMPEQIRDIVRHWLAFYHQHMQTFQTGHWQTCYRGSSIRHAVISTALEGIVFLLDECCLPSLDSGKRWHILNLSPQPLGLSGAVCYDEAGREIAGKLPCGGRGYLDVI